MINKKIGFEWILNQEGLSEMKEVWISDETNTLHK